MKNNKGFTIVELMIAISVFTTILLLTTVGIIQISKAYYRGIVQATTQQTARSVMNSVAQNIQFSSFPATSNGIKNLEGSLGAGYIIRSVCLGDQQQYSYLLNYKQSASRASGTDGPASSAGLTSRHTLWQSTVRPLCEPADVNIANPSNSPSNPAPGKELLGENMRITNFQITQASPLVDPELYRVSVTIMYGDDDLIDRSNPDSSRWSCMPLGGVFSSAFCAKSELTTVVGKRLSLGIE